MIKVIFTFLGLIMILPNLNAQDSTQVFSLKEAQEYAINNNRQVQNARLDVSISKKKIWETIASGLPQVNSTISHNYMIDIPVTMMPAKIFNPNAPEGTYVPMQFGTENNTKFDLRATQLLFSGEYLVGLKAAKIYKELSINQLNKSEQEIKRQIANTYELFLIAQEQETILQKNIENTKKIYSETQALYEKGFSKETDLNQLEINLTRLENAIKSSNNQIDIVKSLLKFQMGIPLEQDIQLSENLEQLLQQSKIDSLFNSTLNTEQHIDFLVLSTQERLQELNLLRAKSKLLPTLSAFYNHQESMMSNDFEVFSGGTWRPANIIGLNINIPLFGSGQKISRISQQKITLDKIKNNKLQISENLKLQFIKAKKQLENSYNTYLLEKRNKKLAQKIYINYQEKYKAGTVSSLELTQAQLQYLNSEQSYFQTIFNLLDAKNKLDQALGL